MWLPQQACFGLKILKDSWNLTFPQHHSHQQPVGILILVRASGLLDSLCCFLGSYSQHVGHQAEQHTSNK